MYGETPVYTAASHGHLNVIKTLCNYGADVREGVVKKCLFSHGPRIDAIVKSKDSQYKRRGDTISNCFYCKAKQ